MIDAFLPTHLIRHLDMEEPLPPETQAIIHATKTVGLNSITEANLDTWIQRIRVLRRCHIELDYIEGEPWWPSYDMLKHHVGIKVTNGDPELNDEDFGKFVIEIIAEETREMH